MAPRILVMEPDATIQALLVEILHAEGYDALAVTERRQALELLRTHSPDALIVNLGLRPARDGMLLLQALEQDPRWSNLPVLVCSADIFGLNAHAPALLAAGYSMLAHPFALCDLRAWLDTSVRLRTEATRLAG